ncbi:MAG: class I SAM-dependent methyltransferase [Planctomycetaceae bacterium]
MLNPRRTYRLPAWRLPPGVAPGTWEYTQRESIANDYSEFLRHTPLIAIDLQWTLGALSPPLPDQASRVIDFGCGDGRAMRALWQRGYNVLGIDLSQPMLARVAQETNGDELGSRLIRANLVQLEGLADSIADHAICLFSTIGMIQGRANRRQFLRHAFRLVKPGGGFVLHVHNRNGAWRDRPSAAAYLASAWQAIRSRDCEWGDRTYGYRGLGDMFLHTYSLGELRRDLVTSGWRSHTITPLSPQGDDRLVHGRWLPSLRAGGFIAVARR